MVAGSLMPPLYSAAAVLSGGSAIASPNKRYDLIVYGSTPSGIMTAFAAARQGLSVALLDKAPHIGGMMTGGLSFTDNGKGETIGGFPREFFDRVSRHYNLPEVWGFEPHVAEEIYTRLMMEAKVTVNLNVRLKESKGVVKNRQKITHVQMESGESFAANVFADCTYDGDLMNAAGVSNTWGRESSSQYGESLAGVLSTLRLDLQFRAKVSPYAADGSLLPGISRLPKGKLGDGDKKVPAYNFRFCFSKDKANQAPFWRPEGYNPHEYELLAQYLPALRKVLGRDLILKDVFLYQPLQGNKADFNNMGAFSTDLAGANWDWPTASYARKAEIAQRVKNYDAGLFYFLSTDPRIPVSLQQELNLWGPAKDEFVDNDHFPWRIYVREARRMVSDFVFTQHDAQERTTKPDSVGIGSYQLDSHNVQRVIAEDGSVENEGDMFAATTPYELPYSCMVPKRGEVTNLLVPVCVSATHAAYGTIRQEPVYMILGQAAGTALAIAAKGHHDVQDVPVAELQKQLLADKAILHWKTA